MQLVMIICFLLTLAYVVLMLLYAKGWRLQKEFILPSAYRPKTGISVIVPARNEAKNIRACLDSIVAQNYPSELFEVIVVDDHSEDNTAGIVQEYANYNVKCIRLSEHINQGEKIAAYKKMALSVGVQNSNAELIVTTDADCIAQPDWLRYLAVAYERGNPVMVVAPVDFYSDNSLSQVFQSLDFMSMQGITAAANKLKMGNMSNGANLAFSKEAFTAVRGYEGIDHIASGDDYLLMMKLQHQYPGKTVYLKSQNAIVRTAPQQSWTDFFQQRIRWASKSGKYNDPKLTTILAFVYLFNLSFLILFIAGFYAHFLWSILLLMLGWKILAELYYLFPVAAFFKKTRQLGYFIFLQPLHIVYIIVTGLLGFAGVYKWKGRVTK